MRRRIFEIIQPDCGNSLASRVFDWTITTLILVSVAIVFAVTFDLPEEVQRALMRIEEVASVVFTVEYLLRILTADLLFPRRGAFVSRIRYVLSPMAIIDLLAILPFWLPMFLPCSMLALRSLRLVRILRILKLNRYFDAIRSIGDVLSSKRRELIGSLFFVGLLMLVSSLLMYSVEHDAQPEVFRNAFSGLWWAVATLTTVGYGDIYPVTSLGRVLGAFIAFSGIAALAIPTGIITAGLTERIGREQSAKDPRPDSQDASPSQQDEILRLVREQGDQLRRLSERIDKTKVA